MAVTVTPQRRLVELARLVSVPLEAAVAAVIADPQRLTGSPLRAHLYDGPGYTLLGVRVPGGRHITREVRVGIGPLLEDDGLLAVPVWWEDAQHPDLFPTFDGGLELRPASEGTELRLAGSYQPPLGAFGRFADGAIGHRIVTASLEAFLADTAQRIYAVTHEAEGSWASGEFSADS